MYKILHIPTAKYVGYLSVDWPKGLKHSIIIEQESTFQSKEIAEFVLEREYCKSYSSIIVLYSELLGGMKKTLRHEYEIIEV